MACGRRDGSIGQSEPFVAMTAELPGEKVLDGMKIDVLVPGTLP